MKFSTLKIEANRLKVIFFHIMNFSFNCLKESRKNVVNLNLKIITRNFKFKLFYALNN